MTLRVLAEAQAELQDAMAWYESHSPGVGDRFLSAVLAGLRKIEERPDAWPFLLKPTRKHVLRKFPYSILFEEDGADVIVVAIAHHSRRPGYWQQR